MKARRRLGTGKTEMPLSSMIDVVFLLLIYFIVTQKPIIEETLLEADLPGGKTVERPPEVSLLMIDVDKGSKNRYKVNGVAWKARQLFEYLKTVADNDRSQTVIVDCGPYATHGKLVKLLDACAEAGLTNINIKDDTTREFRGSPAR
ncbi:MAG: biopolymer transporter ExbD [Kiritimatiellaeota bacterium]|nr:biopolymer transporter ExbD [Kiritimatiellota bacterium]